MRSPLLKVSWKEELFLRQYLVDQELSDIFRSGGSEFIDRDATYRAHVLALINVKGLSSPSRGLSLFPSDLELIRSSKKDRGGSALLSNSIVGRRKIE